MFKDIMSRTDIASLGEYILSGSEYSGDNGEKSFEERLKNADKAVKRFTESKFDSPLAEELCDEIYVLVGEYSSVHFEMGILVGAKAALQLEKKLKELSE